MAALPFLSMASEAKRSSRSGHGKESVAAKYSPPRLVLLFSFVLLFLHAHFLFVLWWAWTKGKEAQKDRATNRNDFTDSWPPLVKTTQPTSKREKRTKDKAARLSRLLGYGGWVD